MPLVSRRTADSRADGDALACKIPAKEQTGARAAIIGCVLLALACAVYIDQAIVLC